MACRHRSPAERLLADRALIPASLGQPGKTRGAAISP
jgi:hypothetical protein